VDTANRAPLPQVLVALPGFQRVQDKYIEDVS
jgi:hypothetical protein